VQTKIAENLVVDHPIRTELIRVYYTDDDPDVAVAVVKSIVRAYYDFATNRNQLEDGKRLNLLDTRRAGIISRSARLTVNWPTRSTHSASRTSHPLLDAKLAEEVKLESSLNGRAAGAGGEPRQEGSAAGDPGIYQQPDRDGRCAHAQPAEQRDDIQGNDRAI